MNNFIIKGDIAYSEGYGNIKTYNSGLLVCRDGLCAGIYTPESLPREYRNFEILDYSGKLVMPGMVDLHIHAPQFNFRGTGMDLELLPWLNTYTFPEESRFCDAEYARRSYSLFADAMKKSATTRACIFATMHREATDILMELMEQSGIVSYVGKINMDRESIPELQEKSFLNSAFDTFGWINGIIGKFENTYPIITPRFIPSCSDELLNELHEIVMTYRIPVQSHLSENLGEVEWVRALCPEAKFYADAYDRYGLFGSESPAVMAHCIYSTDEEIALMKKSGVFVAHCPASNMNLSSGIAPIRRYMDEGLNIGLGSDVAGGESESMFRAIVNQIQVSKLYWRLKDEGCRPVSFGEAFEAATAGGGKFFGKVGRFLEGYEFDAIVIDDESQPFAYDIDIRTRLERAVYLNMDLTALNAKFVRGRRIL